MNFLNRFSQMFLSDKFLVDPISDTRQRAVILVGVLVISVVSGSAMVATLAILYNASGKLLHLAALLIAVLAVAGYLGTLWFFQRRQTLLPSSNLYALTTTFSTVVPCVITGGISGSPYLTVVLVVPIFLFLIAGRKYGMYWTLVTVFCVATLLLAETFGVKFPQGIPDAWVGYFSFISWLTTLGLLVLALSTYESNFENLNRTIIQERGQFAHEALHDPLTGLSNRKLFFTRAREAVDYALSGEQKAVLIYVDLNDFKRINDGFGHDMGDEVLNAVAQRLQSNVRSSDTVARLGGDEFAIVLHGIENAEVAAYMGEKLRKALNEPLIVGQYSVSAIGSMGVAVAPDHGADVYQLLRIADAAMYRAKEGVSRTMQ
jgi:diguanylate cyclase (GGDEF)-like protein